MKWVIFVNNMVYPPLPFLGKKGIINMIRPTKIINIKYIKEVFIKTSKFYEKKKNVHKKHDKQKSSKRNCFNCKKFGHLVKTANKNLVNYMVLKLRPFNESKEGEIQDF